MRLFGRTDVGATPVELDANVKWAARFGLADDGNVAKAAVYLDGQGSGTGAQVVRASIYDSVGTLLGTSDEVLVADGQEGDWIDFAFTDANGQLALAVGDYFVALHGGENANTIRLYGSDPHGLGGRWNADTYSDGPSDPFGAATAVTADFAAFVAYFAPYSAPDETDLYYSRLPLAQAQRILGSGGPIRGTATPVVVGWHSTFTDPEKGSNALVREGGTLEHLLGERIKLSMVGTARPDDEVFAYVHNVMPADTMDEDLSVTRLLYSRLSSLADDNVRVILEVVG